MYSGKLEKRIHEWMGGDGWEVMEERRWMRGDGREVMELKRGDG